MSYANVTDHHEMVFDETRNALYRQALRERLAPGARVMDLGAGLGILGLIALQEGAAEVVMVDPAPVLGATRKLVRALGLDGRVRFLEKRIEAVEERFEVDAILSVFTGNFLLEEDLLPSLFHARDHFLGPGGLLVPDQARMVMVPVDAAELHDAQVARWSRPADGVDLSPLRGHAENTLHAVPRGGSAPQALAMPRTAASFDFHTATDASCDVALDFEATVDGVCHGLCGWFEASLGPVQLSTAPDAAPMHWTQMYLPIAEPVAVRAGQTLTITLHRPAFGEWTWSVALDGRRQRQSTFLAQALSAKDMRRRSRTHRPHLGEEGRALGYLLERFDGTRSIEELAVDLRAAFPRLYPDPGHALRTVQSLSAYYGGEAGE